MELRWVLGKEREFSGRVRTEGLACSGGGPGKDSKEGAGRLGG